MGLEGQECRKARLRDLRKSRSGLRQAPRHPLRAHAYTGTERNPLTETPNQMTPVPIDEVRQRLLRLREELKARQGRAERDLRHGAEPLVADAPDQAIQLQNDEVLREIDSAAVVEVAQIDVALSRLERGLYGICSRCQSAIDHRRLVAVPFAVTCVQCAG